ncbi:hypothetical protein HK104_004303 [Borealophlyctis nickersoniae]|nr:hypothetical protein HK104_004303 [Borealophlyctis nickersoniae]
MKPILADLIESSSFSHTPPTPATPLLMNKPTSVPAAPGLTSQTNHTSPTVLDVADSRHADSSLGSGALLSAGDITAGGGAGTHSLSSTTVDTVINAPASGGAPHGTPSAPCDSVKKENLGSVEIQNVEDYDGYPKRSWRVWFKTFFGFLGPGCLIAVGYMDPGNWATDLSGGSQFHYKLLFAILLSNVMAVLLQSLTVRVGIVTGRDLAQLCRRHFPRWVNIPLYLFAEVAIAACDLAEIIGAAIALNLLFNLPLPWGVGLTVLDVLIILMGFGAKRLRYFEIFIFMLIASVGICFCILLSKVQPEWGDVFLGYVPSSQIFSDPKALFVLMGIVGATVMPHNLYLHSHLVLYRYRPSESTLTPGGSKIGVIEDQETEFKGNPDRPRAAEHRQLIPDTIRFAQLDSFIALTYALFVNSAILIVAGAAFYGTNVEVASIRDGFNFLSDRLGTAAGIMFAIALLCSGQSSTITGTLAGQVVMGGFLGNRFIVRPWIRRIVARSIAIIPAMATAIVLGEKGIDRLLVISQVVLSLQLPFAVWPLVWFTSKKAYMTVRFESPTDPTDPSTPTSTTTTTKNFANPKWVTVLAVVAATIITGLNVTLLLQLFIPGLFPESD